MDIPNTLGKSLPLKKGNDPASSGYCAECFKLYSIESDVWCDQAKEDYKQMKLNEKDNINIIDECITEFKCGVCGGETYKGIALSNTLVCGYDFGGVDCLKCLDCGHRFILEE